MPNVANTLDTSLNQHTVTPKANGSEGDFIVKNFPFNNYPYNIGIVLDNGTQKIGLSPQTIVYLSIDDSLSKWYTTGEMVVKYTYETIENAALISSNGKAFNSYTFRNDGFDFLKISIKPIDPEKTSGSNTSKKNTVSYRDMDQATIHLNFWFSIYHIEDLNSPQESDTSKNYIKYKKFYFRDYRFQKMSTQISEYSTALSPTLQGQPSVVPDSARSIKTGDILDEIIKLTEIDDKLKKVAKDVNPEQWDKGGAALYYTAGTGTSIADSVDYIVERHIAEEGTTYPTLDNTANNTSTAVSMGLNNPTPPAGANIPLNFQVSGSGSAKIHDVCIFSVNRGPTEQDYGYFTIQPLNKFFKNAGKGEPKELQLEHFFIATPEGKGIGTGANFAPSGPSTKGKIKDVTLHGQAAIKNYKFVDVSPQFNASEFVPYVVHSFDFKARNYRIDYESHTTELARKFIGEHYIGEIMTGEGSVDEKFLLNINKDKTEHKNMKPVFSMYGESNELQLTDGIHRLLYSGLFQNACINFDTQGQTYREPGTFIGIDRHSGGNKESTFDTRFFGQWFVIKVVHYFTASEYYNNITAVKLHRHVASKLKFVDY